MTTANMGLTEPTDHGSNATWGSILNGTLDLIDAHDHTTGKGVKIPSAALNINADVSWSSSGTNYAITDVRALDFVQVTAASVSALADALFVSSADSNLYFRNHTGTNVQITSGTTLNVSIVGGIGGDYSSVSALLSYVDASRTYLFQQEVGSAVRQYAKVAHADIGLFEYIASPTGGVPTNSVTLKSPSALAGSYSVTLPAAVPAAQAIVQMGPTGTLTASNTLASNENLTLQGTGFIKHSTWTRTVTLLAQCANTSGGGGVTVTGGTGGGQVTASCTAYFPMAEGLLDTEQVTTVKIKNRATGTGNVTVDVVYLDDTLGVFSSATAGASTVATGATGYTTMAVTGGGPPFGGQSGRTLWVKVVCAATNTFDVTNAIITTTA